MQKRIQNAKKENRIECTVKKYIKERKQIQGNRKQIQKPSVNTKKYIAKTLRSSALQS